MKLTDAQQEAIAARGNVLVVAGAGTGKTKTLVERCLHLLLGEQRVSIDEILMVTFTEAAAAEMRERIRNELEKKLAESEQTEGGRTRTDSSQHLREQLALFETAHIGTLHSFCLKLVRQHFYQLELDPQLSVLPEEEASLLAQETLEKLLEKHYAGGTGAAEAVQELIQTQGRGWDKPIQALLLRLHHYTQTRLDPAGWFNAQIESFAAIEPRVWKEWLLEAIEAWRQRWLPLLQREALGNEVAEKCAAALRKLQEQPSQIEAGAAFERIAAACQEYPKGKKREWIEPLKAFRAETDFLASLAPIEGKVDPVAEDWGWVRSQMMTLLRLAAEFAKAFTEAKRELAVVDFHDLEQFALQLLWDSKAGAPTKIAREWRQRLRFVFVDEYQDINQAQDQIISALSRDDAHANRFLVGDVKQSIYRFRLADPSIFQGYLKRWQNGSGSAIPLVDNFRSREGILSFVNSFFGLLMQPPLGDVLYDTTAELRFGAASQRQQLSLAADRSPRVEVHLRLKPRVNNDEPDEATEAELDQIAALQEADKEARLIALRVRELKAEHHPIWDKGLAQFRPVEWRDIAILLRSPAKKAESYAKEFARLKAPLLVERGGFYKSLEVSDLISLLQLLDNPLQDLPLLAVLRSPLVGLALNELATVRLAAKGPFWTALVRWHESLKSKVQSPKSEQSALVDTFRKVSTFLGRYAQWRRLARQTSLSRCLETVLAETHYSVWLLTQPRGQQRQANLQRLLALAEQFDQFQRQSLFRFLCFVEAQQAAETEPEVAAVSDENSVRLMSIHQSKGLEFPVVVVADCGKAFNLADLRADIILDEAYGLCPQIKPPHTGQRYPSLPYWLARQRQSRETLGEELRLLYVAMTRARDTLLLSASISKNQFTKTWKENGAADSAPVIAARSFADWIGYWFSQHCTLPDGQTKGENSQIRWTIHRDSELLEEAAHPGPDQTETESAQTASPEVWHELQQRLSWNYPFTPATLEPAKTSVSTLRRRAAEQLDDETLSASRFSSLSLPQAAADIGTAHHKFLQSVGLDRVGSLAELKAEARRLVQQAALTDAEVKLLDFQGLADFWQCELGKKVRAQAQHVQRELAFTARFSPQELAAFTSEPRQPNLEQEFIVVQGVVDLAVFLPHEIWLVDFKTDRVTPKQLAAKAQEYQPQVGIYAATLSRIYQRPVSSCWLYFLAQKAAIPISSRATSEMLLPFN